MPIRTVNPLKEFITNLIKWFKYNKAIVLDKSEMVDVHTWSEYPEVNSVVEVVYKDLIANCEFSGNKQIRTRHIKVLVLDLYVKWLKDPTMFVSIYLAKWYYEDLESRYNKLHMSAITREVVKALHSRGWIELVLGHYAREQGYKSHTTRIQATSKLINLFETKNVTSEMIERYPSIETLILRETQVKEKSSKNVDVAYNDRDDSRIPIWRQSLVAYNNLLRRTYIDIQSAPSEGIPCRQGERSKRLGKKPKRIKVTQHDKFVRRIFNNKSWDDGGRFYGGWWQRIPEQWRAQIRIWNSPVTEIDFKGLHINLLYRLRGIAFEGDPYHLSAYPEYNGNDDMRALLKQVMLCAINAESKTKAIQAVNKEVNFNPEKYSWVKEDELNLGELIDALAAEHPALADDFFSGSGIELQNLDSIIAEKVINHFTAREIVVLCIHDSFVIPAYKAEELKQVMETAYIEAFQEMGIDTSLAPNVDLTGLDLGQWNVIMSHPDWREFRDSFEREPHDYPEWAERLRNFRVRAEMADYNPNYYIVENEGS